MTILKKGLGNLTGEYRELDDLQYLVKVTNDGPGPVDKPFLTISFFDGRGSPVAWVPLYDGFTFEWDCEPGYADETHRITCRFSYASLKAKETVQFRVNIRSGSAHESLDKSPVLKRFTKRGLVVKASVGTSTKERTKANNRDEQATAFVAIIG